jgi:hypothetical protein
MILNKIFPMHIHDIAGAGKFFKKKKKLIFMRKTAPGSEKKKFL